MQSTVSAEDTLLSYNNKIKILSRTSLRQGISYGAFFIKSGVLTQLKLEIMYCDGAAETAEQGKAPAPKPTT